MRQFVPYSWHHLVVGSAVVLGTQLLVACDQQPVAATIDDAGTPDAIGIDAAPNAGPIVNISLARLSLSPAFSASVTDYYARCGVGDNAATLVVTYADASTQSISLDVLENQQISIAGQYFIRCVPHDFPSLTVTTHTEGTPSPGYYVLQSNSYVAVLDTNGTPIWYANGTSLINADAQRPNLISFMSNATLGSIGSSLSAYYDLRDLTTDTSTSVRAISAPTDVHELQLLSNGHYLVQAFIINSDVDLTGLASYGDDELIADCQIQEVDGSGGLVWSWLASDHIDPVQESLEPANTTINGQTVVDVFHCNSIESDAQGNLLISVRHNNALYYIDRSSGHIVWKMGGTTFNKDGASHIDVVGDPEIAFSMQHDARLRPNGDITMFDDHGAPSATGVARGVEYAIDTSAKTATYVWQYLGPQKSQYEGSFRRYTDGHSVIGWGGMLPDPRSMTEVDENGNDVLDVAFSISGSISYRAIKVPLSQLDITLMRATAGK